MNANFTLLDQYLSGDAAIPALDVTGTVAAGGFATTGEIQGGNAVFSSTVDASGFLTTGAVNGATAAFTGIVVIGGAASIGSITGHLNQSGTNSWAGSCNMGGTSSCNITLLSAYNTQPICIVTEQSASSVIAGGCSVSGTTVTIGAASANSQNWSALVIGNPN
jgi:hypothetical protein